MIQNILATLIIFVFQFFAETAGLYTLSVAKNLPRTTYIIFHYALDILVATIVFGIYFKFVNHFSPFTTVAISMVSLFSLEFIFFKFFYKGDYWFLNFADYIVPAFIYASTIYLVGTFLNK